MSFQPVNIWDVANNPPEATSEFWGKVGIDAFQAVFVDDPSKPGKKMKVPYFAGQVMPDGSEPRPATFVKVDLAALPEMKASYPIFREIMVNNKGEWGQVVLPSIRDCGIMQVETINGKFARIEMAPSGRTYVKDGETKDATTIKFVKIFDTEQACRDDYKAARGNGNGGNGHAQQPVAQVQAPAQTQTQTNDNKERNTALTFAKVYIKKAVAGAGGDLDKARQALAQSLASQALLAKYFTVDSSDIVEMLMAEML